MTEGNRFDNGTKWIFLLVVEMKSERRMRKAYLLKDIENFEKYYLWSLETKNLKPIFDGYVKNNLEQKLIEYDVDISTKDYRITDKWLLPEFEDANPFYFYYNIKFRDVYDLVSSRLGEVRISEDTFKEINKKPRLIISFIKNSVGLFIQDIFRGDLRLIYLLEDKFYEMEKVENIAKRYARELYEYENKNRNLKSGLSKEKNESNPGRKPKFNTESELHKAIKKIPNWEKLSPEKISIELGFSKSWLRGFITDEKRNWSLPQKES